MAEILHREFVYLWYYFTLQLGQIFPYWVLGMVLGSAISVFAKGSIHALFGRLQTKRLGALGLIPASVLGIASPRGVLKEAYAAGVITDAETWNRIIEARNITSHVYDEKTAQTVAYQIAREFLPVLQKLGTFYRE